MQYGVEDFEKTVAAVRDDTKVLVVLQRFNIIPCKTFSGGINRQYPKNVRRPT